MDVVRLRVGSVEGIPDNNTVWGWRSVSLGSLFLPRVAERGLYTASGSTGLWSVDMSNLKLRTMWYDRDLGRKIYFTINQEDGKPDGERCSGAAINNICGVRPGLKSETFRPILTEHISSSHREVRDPLNLDYKSIFMVLYLPETNVITSNVTRYDNGYSTNFMPGKKRNDVSGNVSPWPLLKV